MYLPPGLHCYLTIGYSPRLSFQFNLNVCLFVCFHVKLLFMSKTLANEVVCDCLENLLCFSCAAFLIVTLITRHVLNLAPATSFCKTRSIWIMFICILLSPASSTVLTLPLMMCLKFVLVRHTVSPNAPNGSQPRPLFNAWRWFPFFPIKQISFYFNPPCWQYIRLGKRRAPLLLFTILSFPPLIYFCWSTLVCHASQTQAFPRCWTHISRCQIVGYNHQWDDVFRQIHNHGHSLSAEASQGRQWPLLSIWSFSYRCYSHKTQALSHILPLSKRPESVLRRYSRRDWSAVHPRFT